MAKIIYENLVIDVCQRRDLWLDYILNRNAAKRNGTPGKPGKNHEKGKPQQPDEQGTYPDLIQDS